MSARRLLASAFAIVSTFSWSLETVAFAQAFPRSSLQPSATTAPIASRQLAGAPLPAPVMPNPGAQTVRIDLGGGGPGQTRMMALPKGKSAIIELPVDARDVLVSDPKVADVVLSTPRRIYVLGMGAGQTDAVFFDAAGRQLLNLNIRVDQDISSLSQTLNRVLPGASVHVEALNDSLILSGSVPSLSSADKALQLARSMVAKPEQVINMLSIAEPDQVMLKVRIVEVDRTVVKQLGVNMNAVFNQLGMDQIGFATASTFGVNGALLGGLTGGYSLDTTKGAAPGSTTTTNTTVTNGSGFSTALQVDQNGLPLFSQGTAGVDPFGRAIINNGAQGNFLVPNSTGTTNTQTTINSNGLPSSQQQVQNGLAGSKGLNQADAMLKAFERVGLVRTLAEPNLTAVSGEAAKFLAGGEFPVPVGQDNSGRVSIEFKPFGVGLGFTPVVLDRGRISLKISTEYSELTQVGAFSLSNGTTSSVTVPGLNVRRAETMVELPSGGGMMIAGLLQNVTKQTIDSLPGLMQLPVLGALFRSRDFVNNETELVVIVSAYIVKPTSPDRLQTPADGLQIATDVQTTLLGRLNKASGRASKTGSTFQGPYGYVVD